MSPDETSSSDSFELNSDRMPTCRWHSWSFAMAAFTSIRYSSEFVSPRHSKEDLPSLAALNNDRRLSDSSIVFGEIRSAMQPRAWRVFACLISPIRARSNLRSPIFASKQDYHLIYASLVVRLIIIQKAHSS